jgi:hypothetical protein
VSDVTGFFYPRTATGRASLLPAPPWHYSGDLLTVEYRTDPARVAELAAQCRRHHQVVSELGLRPHATRS